MLTTGGRIFRDANYQRSTLFQCDAAREALLGLAELASHPHNAVACGE
jgi:hypothetical protein